MKALFLLFASLVVGYASEAERPWITIGQVLQVLPVGLQLKQGKHWQAQSAATANTHLAHKALKHAVEMQAVFTKFELRPKATYGPSVVGVTQESDVIVQGVTCRLRLYVYFESEELEKLSVTHRAAAFAGTLGRCDFSENGRVLNIDIVRAHRR